MAAFPQNRPRRLRRTEALRKLVRRTELSLDHVVMPLFVRPGSGIRQPIGSMPGQFQFSVDTLTEEATRLAALGVPAVLLFGIPERKDPMGTRAYDDGGVVQQAIRSIKARLPAMIVITDVCLCEYTDHGHCGVVRRQSGGEVTVDNDATLPLLARMASSHARAGADLVAPSDMMDGRVGVIRTALDEAGLTEVGILSYAAKYASSFYGPFREAAESVPQFGDRGGYQMDPAGAEEALREVALDLEEGADVIMVKPALAYLDVIRRVRETFNCPVAAYSVSGEYAAVKAAAEKGWLDERAVALEILTAIRRAGADVLITYWAADLAGWLK